MPVDSVEHAGKATQLLVVVDCEEVEEDGQYMVGLEVKAVELAIVQKLDERRQHRPVRNCTIRILLNLLGRLFDLDDFLSIITKFISFFRNLLNRLNILGDAIVQVLIKCCLHVRHGDLPIVFPGGLRYVAHRKFARMLFHFKII